MVLSVPKETVLIPLSRGWPLEAAATLFAAMAYPGDLRSRDRFRVAFCHEAFVQKMAQDPEVGKSPIPAEYLTPVPGSYGQGLTRIHARGVAGQMLLGLIEPRLFGMTKPSVNLLAGLAAGSKNVANVKDRAWKRSRAVIHAACAFALVRENMTMLGLADTLGDFIDEPVLIERVVTLSEDIRTQILPTCNTKWVPPSEAETIQFVIA